MGAGQAPDPHQGGIAPHHELAVDHHSVRPGNSRDGPDVVAAHTLHDAKRRVADADYDLVILDITLGDGSGLDILPLLGQEGRTAPPVILYSATEPSRELTHRVQGRW
jgi:DNA-binding response OmpR family regulator